MPGLQRGLAHKVVQQVSKPSSGAGHLATTVRREAVRVGALTTADSNQKSAKQAHNGVFQIRMRGSRSFEARFETQLAR